MRTVYDVAEPKKKNNNNNNVENKKKTKYEFKHLTDGTHWFWSGTH